MLNAWDYTLTLADVVAVVPEMPAAGLLWAGLTALLAFRRLKVA